MSPMSNSSSPDIGYDLSLEVDPFSKPKLVSEGEFVKNLLLTVLWAEPKNFPSFPHIGMKLRDLLYTNYNELKEEELIEFITKQCSALDPYFQSGMIQLKKNIYNNQPSLMILIDVTKDYSYLSHEYINSSNPQNFFIGITYDELGKMLVDISSNRVTN